MKEIKTLSDIDTSTIEGKMLVCAIDSLKIAYSNSCPTIIDVIDFINNNVAKKFPPPERWVNVYDNDETGRNIFSSKKEAESKKGFGYLETVQLVRKEEGK